MSALRDWARREPAQAALFLVAAIASILPIWIGRYLPLLDYPNHLSMVFVWFHLKDPSWRFDEWYQTNLVPLPYWAQYAFIYALSYVMPTEIAQKIFLSLAVLGLPASAAVLARRFGRDPRLCIFAFPLAWNFSMANGFLSYVGALPVMFFALAALDRYGERPSLKWGVAASLLGASLYLFHILPWAMFLAIGGFTVLLAPRPWTWWRAIVAGLPTLPALGIGYWAWHIAETIDAPFNPANPRGLSGINGLYNDLAGNLSNVFHWLINFFPGQSDELAVIGLAAAWLFLYATRPVGGAIDPPQLEDRGPQAWRAEVATLVAIVILFKLPRSLTQPFYWYAVNYRVAVVVGVLLALCVRGPVVGVRKLFLGIAGVAGIVFCLDVSAHFYRFNQKAHGFDEVMEMVPPGKQVLPLMLMQGDPEVTVNCFNQWGSWVQLRQGGYMLFNFVGDFPIRYKKKLPAPPWDHPEQFDFAKHGEAWDYYVVHRPSPVDPFVKHHDRVRLVKQSGQWELWEKLPGAAPAPAPPLKPMPRPPQPVPPMGAP